MNLNDLPSHRRITNPLQLCPKETRALLRSNARKSHSNLLAVELRRVLPDPESGRVVAAHLGKAAAAGPGSDIVGVGEQVDRFEAGGVVRPDRPEDDEQLCLSGRGHAEAAVEADEGGPDVEGGGRVVGHPLLVNLDQPEGREEPI